MDGLPSVSSPGAFCPGELKLQIQQILRCARHPVFVNISVKFQEATPSGF